MSTSMVATASGISAHSSAKLAGRCATRTLSLTYLHTEESKGDGQAMVPPCPIHDEWQDF